MTTLLSLLLLPSTAEATEGEAPLGVHAQVRPRIEFSTGKDGAAGGEVFAVSQRARFGVHSHLKRFGLRATFQDVRMWGAEANTLTDFTGDTMDLHEGWVSWMPSESFGLKLGRQELIVHEERLIGATDWAQQGRAFDAATASGSAGIFSTDFGVAVIADKDSVVNPENAVTGFVRAGVAPGKKNVADVLVIVENAETTELMRVTGGVYARLGKGSISGRVEAYGQMGTLAEKELQAGMVGVRGTWAPEGGVEPSVTVWYDLLSGDDDATDGKNTTFQTLYASNHKFYGLMDVMAFTTAGAVDGQGLHDGALKLGIQPTDGLRLNLDAHVFAAAAPIDEALLGQEVDLWAGGKIDGKLQVNGGASCLLWSDDRKPDAWVWLQTSFEL